MKTVMRIPQNVFRQMHLDLSRPHHFAAERVGFLVCGAAQNERGDLQLLVNSYQPVADHHYLDDVSVGAMMGPDAIRTAMQWALSSNVGLFHVHRHEHNGRPRFSRTDLRHSHRFVPDFFKVRPEMPHGAIVFSHDSMAGLCWMTGETPPEPISQCVVIGPQMPGVRAIA